MLPILTKRPSTALRLLHSTTLRAYSAPTTDSIPEAKQKYVPSSGTYPSGFVLSSTHVGVKASNTRHDDLTLVASTTPCTAAAVFTTNRFQAAPVTVSREMLTSRGGEGVWGVVVNSGCANAVTGKGGIEDAKKMGSEADRCLELEGVVSGGSAADGGKGLRSIVMSTGVIGQRLPIDKILSKIPTATSTLSSSHDAWLRASRAICTTDTFPKLVSSSFTIPSSQQEFHIAGMAKGAGMIHPNMATLLSIICTDAPVAPEALRTALTAAVDKSFNSISVDGDTSTNDTVAVLANGASSTATITTPSHPGYPSFLAALTQTCTSLAQLIVRDGEGATKFVAIRVTGAPSAAVGKRIAATVAKSPLVKTALYGRDANWGRILCAVGYAEGVPEGAVVPERVSVSFVPVRAEAGMQGLGVAEATKEERSGELKLLVEGEPQVVDEARAAEMLKEEDLEILIRLRTEGDERGVGEEVVFWTCDFSHEYVTINGDYRT